MTEAAFATPAPDFTPDVAARAHKPRLILMGEFSSGKSTLSNILLGGPTLPMQVTATRLPPVFVSHGEPSAHAITRDGQKRAVDPANLCDLTPEVIRSIHLTMISDTLELCDLVDMPGISDPNMPSDTWDAVVRKTDHVIWCTHATQAWRQSEAAFWDRMRGATCGQNILLITQFDKLRNERDQSRVLNRIMGETEGKFSAIHPICLLQALQAEDDFDAWKASGANDLMEHLIEMLMNDAGPAAPSAPPRPLQTIAAAVVRPAFGAAPPEVRVIPRRVKISPNIRRPTRPLRSATYLAGVWPMEPGGQ